jgi:DNA-binding transcriptional ArsR family regulator
METNSALACFAALSQGTRLDTVKLLVRVGDEGLPAGEIAAQLDVSRNLMSVHLAKLEAAGLVSSQRAGRSIIYRADYATLRSLIGFLMEDCCSGVPAIVGNLALSTARQGECP